MSPYVRTVKTASGARAVQIVYSSRRGSLDIEHIGSAHEEAQLEVLKAAARQRLAAGQRELDLGLGSDEHAAAGAPLLITSSRKGTCGTRCALPTTCSGSSTKRRGRCVPAAGAGLAVFALLATSSSVNANIYGAVGSTAKLAEAGQFPRVFGRAALVGSTRGLTISVVAVLLLANLVDLTAIASLGSVVALAIFLLVAVVGLRLRAETRSRTW